MAVTALISVLVKAMVEVSFKSKFPWFESVNNNGGDVSTTERNG